jgi:hypothetical protein
MFCIEMPPSRHGYWTLVVFWRLHRLLHGNLVDSVAIGGIRYFSIHGRLLFLIAVLGRFSRLVDTVDTLCAARSCGLLEVHHRQLASLLLFRMLLMNDVGAGTDESEDCEDHAGWVFSVVVAF